MKCRASLRISDDNLEPAEITKILCIEPDKSHKKNDPNLGISKKGKIFMNSTYTSGLWSIDSKEDESMNLEHHIASLLHVVYPMKDKFTMLSNMGYKINVFCGVFAFDADQPGFSICPDVLQKLGELNIMLDVCIY